VEAERKGDESMQIKHEIQVAGRNFGIEFGERGMLSDAAIFMN